MADAQTVRQVCDIVLAERERRVVVVSAPGKRHRDDHKVTDMLIQCAEHKLNGGSFGDILEAIVKRFTDIEEQLGVKEGVGDEIAQDLWRRVETIASSRAAFLDLMKAAGEDNCARLTAAVLRTRGCEAHYINPGEAGMLLTADFGNAQLLPESYRRLEALRGHKGVLVVPGFFGHTPAGEVVTFPRGGSDITGAILAAALRADKYENFTDVDSVFAVDPRLVPDAQPIPELTFREMRELAYAGFSVLHEEAIIPAVRAGIPIYVKNTQGPQLPGTKIVAHHAQGSSRVVGIASSDGFCTIYASKYLMNREIGFGRRLLQILEEEGLSFEHSPSGIDNMSVIVRAGALTTEKERHVLQRIREELDVDDVDVERGLALVMIVGEGMRYAIGIAARATGALAAAGVNIEMMNQGSSEISMMFGVKAEDRVRAVQAIYRALFGEPGQQP